MLLLYIHLSKFWTLGKVKLVCICVKHGIEPLYWLSFLCWTWTLRFPNWGNTPRSTGSTEFSWAYCTFSFRVKVRKWAINAEYTWFCFWSLSCALWTIVFPIPMLFLQEWLAHWEWFPYVNTGNYRWGQAVNSGIKVLKLSQRTQ